MTSYLTRCWMDIFSSKLFVSFTLNFNQIQVSFNILIKINIRNKVIISMVTLSHVGTVHWTVTEIVPGASFLPWNRSFGSHLVPYYNIFFLELFLCLFMLKNGLDYLRITTNLSTEKVSKKIQYENLVMVLLRILVMKFKFERTMNI